MMREGRERGARVRARAPTASPTLRHALEDVQEAHEEVLDLVPVQLVAAQHGAAQRRRTLVLEEGGRVEERCCSLSGRASRALTERFTPATQLQRRKDGKVFLFFFLFVKHAEQKAPLSR